MQWQRDYWDDEADFAELRRNAGWLFLGPLTGLYERFYGEDFAAVYQEFGVTPSGWPVRRTP